MHTEADEHRDAALEHIDSALQHLNKIVVERCWGYDEYKIEYRMMLTLVHNILMLCRDKFTNWEKSP